MKINGLKLSSGNQTHANRKQLTERILSHEKQNHHSPALVGIYCLQPDLLL